ncbi:MAG: ChaN family lipoprotein [Xylophilus ampelinus]
MLPPAATVPRPGRAFAAPASPERDTRRGAVRRAAVGAAPLAAALLAAGCAAPGAGPASADGPGALPAADVLLVGEIHDAPGQAERAADAVRSLAASRRLAALALEMAEQGRSTAALPSDADAAAVRAALAWDARAWPWERYGPVAMAAVRAGVPVLGANLPRAAMRAAREDVSLDAQLPPDARLRQEAAVRDGHCGLLPAAQVGPMARIQIARDRAMARTVAEAVRPGRTVLLLAGAAHVDRALGVPQHLGTQWSVRSIVMRPAGADGLPPADAVWDTPAAPVRDHCAELAARPAPAASGPRPSAAGTAR